MTMLRINLHIRSDVSPRLYAALAVMPPRPRAELLRKLAELGLQIESGQVHSLNGNSRGVLEPGIQSPPSAPEASGMVTDEFSSDLVSLLDMTAIVPGESDAR